MTLDAVVQAIISAAPQFGAVGVLLALFGLYVRASLQDRSDYRTQLADATKRHNEELDELKSDIRDLRKQIDDLHAQLDLEREARRKAEDRAAASERKRGPRAI